MNSENTQEPLNKAIYRLFRPLIQLLLRNGITYEAFSDIAKRVYIETAMRDMSTVGKKHTDSRIALVTGLTRKDISNHKDHLLVQDDFEVNELYSHASRVVFAWVHEPDYVDGKGKSKSLPFENGNPCFTSLVQSYVGDVSAQTLLDELLRVGVIEQQSNGNYRLRERAYIPDKSAVEKIRILGQDVAGLISTIDHNIYETDKERFFHRKVFYDNLPEEAIAPLRKLLAKKGQRFLEIVDKCLAKHDRDVNPKAGGTGKKSAGIGIFYFEENDKEEK